MESGCPVTFAPLSARQLRDPYPVYRDLREHDPVHHEADLDLWIVSRHEDVTRVALDTTDFSSIGSVQTSTRPFPPEVQEVLAGGIGDMIWMTASDDPDHKRVRSMVNLVFTPKRVREMEPQIARYVDELIDVFVGDGKADIVELFAWPLPLWGLAEILGVPRQDLGKLHEWSYNWLRLMQATDSLEDLVRFARDYVSLQHYVLDAMQQRQSQPRNDLMTALLDARTKTTPELSVVEAAWVPINLIVAGHVTVTRAIGNGLMLLFERPEMLEALQDADDTLMAHAVEEILRYESPAQGLFRTARRDVEVGGVTIPAGAKVMIHFGSANRDETAFHDPATFRLERDDVRSHLAFGKGPHFCVGAPLARSELRLSFQGLLRRLPNLRPDGPGTRDTIFFARGWSHLPVEWDVSV